MSYKPRIHEGQRPRDVQVTCPDCGTVRYRTPSEMAWAKSDRCKSCAQRRRWQNRLRADRGLPPLAE